jgi:L-asparaginase II
MPAIEFGHQPLVKVTRGDAVESVHYGALAVVDSRGEVMARVGSPESTAFLRSAAKPFQALPLITSGAAARFGITSRELAVIVASHNGEKAHLDAVLSILKKTGIRPAQLQCGAHMPFYRPAAAALARKGRAPSVLHNNCSGKHAGMLGLAKHWGIPGRDYLAPAHPVQATILKVISAYSGASEGAILGGVDGCSAPTFALSLRQAALAYARLLDPRFGTDEERAAADRVVAAMRAHPIMVAGTGRLDTALMKSIGSSFISKIGAEGFYGMAYREGGRGIGIALKIADGDGERARTGATVELLAQLGLLDPGRAAKVLKAQRLPEVRNVRGRVVGRVAALFDVR